MVAQNAESAEADMLVGEALDEMKDTIGATREFRAAVQTNPKEPNAHFGLGYLLWTQMQYQEASQEFQAELENTPDYTQAMLYLADADIRMNRNEDVLLLLEKVVKIDPASSMARLDLGVVYAEADHKEDALREFKAAAALKPDDVNVHMRLGRLYRSMGKANEAKNEFDKASSLNRAAHDALITVMSSAPEKGYMSPASRPPNSKRGRSSTSVLAIGNSAAFSKGPRIRGMVEAGAEGVLNGWQSQAAPHERSR